MVGSIICMRTVGFLYGVGVTLKESIWHGGRRLVGVGVRERRRRRRRGRQSHLRLWFSIDDG